MEPLLQLFEFSYPDGYLFLDRGGLVCRRLREWIPGLEAKTVERMEIGLHAPGKGLELYFGIRTAAIHSTADNVQDFGAMAAEFTRVLANALELSSVESFRFRQVVGRPCDSLEDAVFLMRPLIAQETQERLGKVAATTEWRAVQAEYIRNNLLFQDRIAVLDLTPKSEPSRGTVPHITVQFDIKGLVPVLVSELDVEALVRNLGQQHLDNVISKIAPHLKQP